MDGQQEKSTALVTRGETALTAGAEKELGYWGKNAHRLTVLSRILLLLLVAFVLVFTLVNYRAFSPLSLYYFGQDIKGLPAQVGGEELPLYYDYGGEAAAVVAYRGGACVASPTHVKIYATDGELLLSLAHARAMKAPRAVVSRDYLIVYDFGSTDFLVFNAHDLLHEGKTDAPILGVGLSDAGCFSLITAGEGVLSAVELYDAGFRRTHSFGRAAATVAAPLSGDGRTLALVGATRTGAQVDFISFGESEARAGVTLAGFPLAAAFTTNGVLTVLTTEGLYTVTSMGKTLAATDFAGGVPLAYDISAQGAVVSLQTDSLTGATTVIAVGARGRERMRAHFAEAVTAVALGDTLVFALSGETASLLSLRNGEVAETKKIPAGWRGITATDRHSARIIYPAMALPLTEN